MSRVAVPVIKIRYSGDDAYDLAIMDIFERAGVWEPQETFTYTGRVAMNDSTEPEIRAQQEKLTAEIRAVLPADQASRLIALLEEHGWDVSFFVDTF